LVELLRLLGREVSRSLRLCAVIPVFDHADTVAEVAREASSHLERVIVVDDGSGDGSGLRAEAAARDGGELRAIEVLRLPRNEGKGRAILAGLRRAGEHGFTHAVVLDADGQHRPSDIPRLVAAAEEDDRSIVVGARDLRSPNVPPSSRVGRWMSNFWILRTTGADLPDTQCGYRVYPIDTVLGLNLARSRYEFEVEVLVRAAWAGCRLQAVPIDVWYPPRSERVSHFRAVADNLRISWTYTTLALARLLPTRRARSEIRSAPRPKLGLREGIRRLREVSTSGLRSSELALAVGVGAFIGATPLWGLHGILSIYVGARLHLNPIAAFVGSNVSMPLVAPWLVWASVHCGRWMVRGDSEAASSSVPPAVHDYLLEYAIGFGPVAALSALALGTATFVLAAGVARVRR
jgi:glycosyltransferase involved in cell wall biosynthesis